MSNNFRNKCESAFAIAYLLEDEIDSLKLEEISHKDLRVFMQNETLRLGKLREQLSIAAKHFCILEGHLKESKVDFKKEFDDERISKKIEKGWELADKICEENRRKMSFKGKR